MKMSMTGIYFCIIGKHASLGAAIWQVFMTGIVIGAFLLLSVSPETVRAAEEKGEVPHTTTTPQKNADAGSGVVARVNGVEIMQTALKAKMMRMLATRIQGDTSSESRQGEALRRDALNKLIIQELAYQRAKAEGIAISKDELDNAIDEIKADVGGEEKYRETLEKGQRTEDDLRRDLERNLTIKHIFEKEVSGRIVISEEDMKKEYAQIKEEFSKPEKVVVYDMVLFLALDDSHAVQAAEGILKKIKDDPQKDLMNIVSDGTFLVREVELNKNRDKGLYAEALKLKEGEVSAVIRTADSFHIIKLKKYSPEKTADFAQVKGFIERRLRAQAQQKRMAEWEAEMKKDAKIELMDEQVKE
jgi:parvulin-like peptidyl-prolyl isomerase